MSAATATRNLLARFGRAMTVRRRVGTGATFTTATAHGALGAYRPDQLVGGVMQGDAQIILDAAPIIAAGLAPLVKGDQVVADGRTWAAQGVQARYDGPRLCAFELWVRGG